MEGGRESGRQEMMGGREGCAVHLIHNTFCHVLKGALTLVCAFFFLPGRATFKRDERCTITDGLLVSKDFFQILGRLNKEHMRRNTYRERLRLLSGEALLPTPPTSLRSYHLGIS